ncbi:MAG: GNAT family N-acetyltransferase [Hyellaceae cyanobacterium CSU_1_1]|nr:GNAT family N-acetyltransferase [Hyellaceae cyanobacterium CSU_1_1]
MDICAIAEQDLQVVSQLYVSVFSGPPWNEDWEFTWAYERLQWIYQSKGFVGYIAINDDQTLGAIMGHFVPFKGNKGFEIVELLVATHHQNQGIGNKLLTKLELTLQQDNYDNTWLLTAKDSDAESFYSKHSYQRERKIVLLNKEL